MLFSAADHRRIADCPGSNRRQDVKVVRRQTSIMEHWNGFVRTQTKQFIDDIAWSVETALLFPVDGT